MTKRFSTIEVQVRPEAPPSCYPIVVGRGILERLSDVLPPLEGSKRLVVYDEKLESSALPRALRSLPEGAAAVGIPGDEAHKGIALVDRLWKEFVRCGLDRRSIVYNLGGGMLTDLSGFAASSYMRGIRFVQLPTTLLSQVDASVGGKVGVNVAGVKNLVGAFQQPSAVGIDLDTLETLPEREFRSGLAEMVKHGIIFDAAYLEELEAAGPLDWRHEKLEWLVARSCEIKADVVGRDEKEHGVRKILNFGHTIGHAIESLSHETTEPLLHGEAVSIGMIGEARIALRLGLLDEKDFLRIEGALEGAGLPVRTPYALGRSRIMELMLSDKKNVGGELRWTLPERIGAARFDLSASSGAVEEALGYITESR